MEVLGGLDWLRLAFSGRECGFSKCHRAAADCGYCHEHAEYMRRNSTESLDPCEWAEFERFEPVEK
jgi:hypothetical protein